VFHRGREADDDHGLRVGGAGIRAVLQQPADRIFVREQAFGDRDVDDHRHRAAHRRIARKQQAKGAPALSQRADVGVLAVGSVVVAEDRIEASRFDEAPLHVFRRDRPALIRSVAGETGAAIRSKILEERILEIEGPFVVNVRS
jgi:hypothetical protein